MPQKGDRTVEKSLGAEPTTELNPQRKQGKADSPEKQARPADRRNNPS
ncbi:hypothetical protein [Paludifilum halophilum]|nr:hypothetical protein [Paludifilum halophilum]